VPRLFPDPSRANEERTAELRAFAEEHELHFASDVDEDLFNPSFALFGRWSGIPKAQIVRTGVNQLQGNWNGVFVKEFDYGILWSATPAFLLPGSGRGAYAGWRVGYSVVAMEIRRSLSPVMIHHRDFLSRLEQEARELLHLPPGRTIVTVGDPVFDREFEVRSRDPDAARPIFSGGLVQALRESTGIAYELVASDVIVYTQLVEPDRLAWLLDAAARFRRALEAEG
jgi:hypothetical protein